MRAGNGIVGVQAAAATAVALKRVAVPIALATRAVYSFIGFPGAPERHLYLHHDGYPTGAAWRLATARRHHGDPAALLEAFVATQPGAEDLSAPQEAADAEYRYRIALLAGASAELQVQCWRRLPGSSDWQPRCSPVTLADFIRRFLPGAME